MKTDHADLNIRWVEFCRVHRIEPYCYFTASIAIRFKTWIQRQATIFGRIHPEHMSAEFVSGRPESQAAFNGFLREITAQEVAT